MPDRIFMPLMGLIALTLIAFSLVWPQGQGDRSWGPFGHTPVQREPAMKAAMQRETEASESRRRQAREVVRDLQTQAITPGQ